MKRNKPPKMPEVEKLQVRARRIVGHDFALEKDRHGRDRLRVGTYEATRLYDISTSEKVVSVRRVDPLQGLSLKAEQRAAGKKFRETFEFCVGEGAPSILLQVRVDGGKHYAGIPEALLSAHESLRLATAAIGHRELIDVVTDICVAGLTAKDVAERTKGNRDVVSKLLRIGLDNLAVHYGIVSDSKRA